MIETNGVVKSKPVLPVRIWQGMCVGIKEVLGQLTRKDFWVNLLQVCAKEMVSAFLKTLGGKFLTYGLQREDPEIKKAAQTMTSTGSSSAFSSGYTPRAEYTRSGGGEFGRPDYRNYPVPVPTSSEQNFPGFGR